ncbi:MAG: response regulator [Anaerolineales bacterium]|nr:response regulator [Anaerolineales bacterium]
MIVDDDNTMVSLLQLLFEMDGYDVVTFSNRDSIVEDIRKNNPDLVLMDVFISNVDGLEILKQVRACEDLNDIRIIMTSGMEVGDKCHSAGADAFILKPYPPEELMSLIIELLPGRKSSTFVD